MLTGLVLLLSCGHLRRRNDAYHVTATKQNLIKKKKKGGNEEINWTCNFLWKKMNEKQKERNQAVTPNKHILMTKSPYSSAWISDVLRENTVL